MKTSALIIVTCVASASAFAPSSNGARSSTQLAAEEKKFSFPNPFAAPAPTPVAVEKKKSFFPTSSSKAPTKVIVEQKKSKSLFKTIFEMDLFAPNKEQNDYGARTKKNVKIGELTSKSYIPAGLSRDQFDKIRKDASKKKAENYQKNVKKAGVFEDYTEFYMKRGTDNSQAWKKDVNLGHRMAKTKYDWSGDKDKPLWAKKN